MDYNKLFDRWLSTKLEDEALTRELESIRGNDKEIEDRFYRELEFGTGGLRGVLGAGTNRMNIYTVRKATQGLADYLNSTVTKPTAAVAYDSRINSERFAQEAAAVFAANGIKAYLYRELMPTPALSFAVRELGCASGINVTASHNPGKYNGYKAYDSSGCQITGEVADAVLANILATDIFDGVKHVVFADGLASGMIEYIGEELIEKYLTRVLEERQNPGLCEKSGLRLVYTPLNGAGRRCVTTVLERMGIKDVKVVKEQEMPDGNFPTCPYPNPEIVEALALGLALVEKEQADLLLATDPDCDRVGTAVLEGGKPRLISGNELGVLLMDYIARSRKAKGTMPARPVVVTTIVSSTMADAVAADHGIEIRKVLTGFKYIGEQIALLEEAGESERFLLGFEESYGYLSGGYVRDKDGVDAAMLACEMAAWYKTQGLHLGQALDAMYDKYGRYLNPVDSYTFEGSDGMHKMSAILDGLRDKPPVEIAGFAVSHITDYRAATRTENGVVSPTGLPSSNVLEYGLSGVGSVIVRPSGTEPKLKVYYSLYGKDMAAVQSLLATVKSAVESLLGL